MEEHASTVTAIEEAGKQSVADHSESDQAWLLWHRIQDDLKDHDQLCHEAKVRLSRFPIFRGTPEVGDGRHALGTLIGLGRAASKLSQSKRGDLKPHITLLDIHPAIMARNLLLFMMIDILVQDTLEAVDRLEVQTTMAYVFIGWIMPLYCKKRPSLEVSTRLPSWLHVDASFVKPIVKALDYWANEKTRITSKVTEHLTYMDPDEMFRAMASIPRMNLQGLGDPVPGMSDKNEPYGLSGEMTKDVNSTWEPNITIFVPNMGDKYLTMQLDAFEPVRLIANINKTYKLSQKDARMIKDSPTMAYMLMASLTL
ncbi:hypothetical protein PILCRDRAFT_11660 [Piloderma croceum F 1598]|uniref:Uncharacterized protein n=1 Tax=Piloderma croceum (strain F 1598) TaxID=765440 RepID=A0A0C3FDN8_PILCF|nr:hypothetical protein PILCRDRAFT_11660 [Piloderma croceum F 1598]